MRGGRAPENMQVMQSFLNRYIITLSNRKDAGGFSKRKRERERMMMMENKRGVGPYAEDDDEEQMSLAVR